MDDDVPAAVLAASWHADAAGYARGRFDGRVQHLHRVIVGEVAAGMVVDHANGDKLDNRRANLRVCRQAENARNARPRRNNSGITGVCWDRTRGKWLAHIKVDRRFMNLGWHESIDAAAAARATAERRHFGAFAFGATR